MKWISVGDFQIKDEGKKAILEVLERGRISEGEKTKEFEKEFARYIGTKYAIALSSGTSAIIAGITALTYNQNLHFKKGTKVITSPVTYIATTNAIVITGFEPVYVDIDPITFNITPEGIEAHLESVEDRDKYSLILPIHLMGYPCDMERINEVAQKYGLVVFEDSAQAHGTLYKGKKAGSLSLLADFSFYIAHNIQAGEMGAITTNDSEINRLIKKIKANGRLCDCIVCTRDKGKCPRIYEDEEEDFDPRFTHDLVGYNFKTMEFQATLGLIQLKRADYIFKKRQSNVKFLNLGLAKYSDILQLPEYSEDVSYLAYPIVIREPQIISRKEIRIKLEKKGIETRPLFGCIPLQQPAYYYLKDRYAGKLPNAEYVGKHGFYIGCHQYLEEDDLIRIIEVFDDILKEKIG